MTATLAPASPATSVRIMLQSLTDLLRWSHGSSRFIVNDAGELVHQATVITVKMERAETIEAFMLRIRADFDWRPGDTLEFLSSGRLETARITRMPR